MNKEKEMRRRADVFESDGVVIVRVPLGKSKGYDWDRLNGILKLYGEEYHLVDAIFRPEIVAIDHISNLPWAVFEKETCS